MVLTVPCLADLERTCANNLVRGEIAVKRP
jgi:hypothetical protein